VCVCDEFLQLNSMSEQEVAWHSSSVCRAVLEADFAEAHGRDFGSLEFFVFVEEIK
jgi:hypothetical protein